MTYVHSNFDDVQPRVTYLSGFDKELNFAAMSGKSPVWGLTRRVATLVLGVMVLIQALDMSESIRQRQNYSVKSLAKVGAIWAVTALIFSSAFVR